MESPPVHLGRGTRQGCTLCPLFVIALEPFAEMITTDLMIKEVTAGTHHTHHKISLYANNTLFVTEPMLTLHHVFADFQTFSMSSGYKVNSQN